MNKRKFAAVVIPILFLWVATSTMAYGSNEPSGSTSSSYSSGDSGPTVSVVTSDSFGPILVDAKGFTLYVYEMDEPGLTKCYGGCAKAWPPLTVADEDTVSFSSAVTGDIGVIDRTDGSYQVTYNGMPLYYFVSDKQPGDTTGQDVGASGRKWYVVPIAASSFDQAESLSEQAADRNGAW